jgi:hypothetical protein
MLERHPLIDEILDVHAAVGADDPDGYEGLRGHAHRVFHYARHLSPSSDPDRDAKIAVAAAFHDLEVFSSLDYLGPSIADADRWLDEKGHAEWKPGVALMIAMHHRFSTYRGEAEELVEPFRRADWNEVLQGRPRMGIPRELIREARAQFSTRTFFSRTIPRQALRWSLRHPLNPAPSFRGRAALEDAARLTEMGAS